MARCRWRLAVLCPHLKKQTNKYGNLENYGMKMNVRHTQHNENVTQQAAAATTRRVETRRRHEAPLMVKLRSCSQYF